MNFIPQFKGRQLFLPKNELPIMSFSRMAFFASMVAMVASIVLWSSMGLNFGVDFKGGSMIEVRAKADVVVLLAALHKEDARAIVRALEQTGGVRTRAADLLGISERNLRYKMEKYQVTGR